jgi:hypothetical protein
MDSRKSIPASLFVALVSFGSQLPSAAQDVDVRTADHSEQTKFASLLTQQQAADNASCHGQVADAGTRYGQNTSAGSTVAPTEAIQACEMYSAQSDCQLAICLRRGMVEHQIKNSPAGFYHTFGGGLIGGSGH